MHPGIAVRMWVDSQLLRMAKGDQGSHLPFMIAVFGHLLPPPQFHTH